MRCGAVRLCAAAAPTVPTGTSLPAYSDRIKEFCSYMASCGATFDGVRVRPDEKTARGLFAECALREGTTVMAVPLQRLALSADRLLEMSEPLRQSRPPSLDEVAHLMTSLSIQDPVMYEQVHLALLLAAEHVREGSPVNAYLNVLPHPAMDDAAVMARHKDVLEPMALVEWDDYQREFLAVLHLVLRRWGSEAPPVEVAYWALRTVLARMHMLPAHGVAPEDVGSTLSYTALSSVDRLDRQTRWLRRIKATFGALMGNPAAGENYRLVPTLVPLLDMAGHVPSGNVQVEVSAREGVGSCVELRALRQIEKGEEIGLRFNSSQSPAFLLYRFGFIPH